MSSRTVNKENERVEDKTPVKINAFQFMMSSRHKVIGSNSPGKERKEDEMKSEKTERIREKLNKRKSTFRDWAEEKGGIKRKLLDEAAEKHIDKTLKKRAKRLKIMLAIIDDELKNSGEECSDNEEINSKVRTKKHRKPIIVDSENSSSSDNVNVNLNDSCKSSNKNETVEESLDGNEAELLKNIKSNTKVPVVQIDILNEKNKLKNKENNLNEEVVNNAPVKKHKKKSLSLRKHKETNENQAVPKKDCSNIVDHLTDEEIFPAKSEKKTSIITNKKSDQLKLHIDSNLNEIKNADTKKECFSPRTWRMRLKPVEDASKDNEHEENSLDNMSVKEEHESRNEESKSEKVLIIDSSPEIKITKHESDSSSSGESKKDVKLAPVFLRQQQKKLEKEALNAKKNFLHSGVPSKMKKLMTKSKSFQETEYVYSIFPKVSHVQQLNDDSYSKEICNLPKPNLNLRNESNNIELLFDQITSGSFTTCRSSNIDIIRNNCYVPPKKLKNLKEIVRELKQEFPSYPVYKTFRLFYQKNEKYTKAVEKIEEGTPETPKPKRGRRKKKKETPQKTKVKFNESEKEYISQLGILLWTEKYKPQSQEEILGNRKSVDELKSWLECWIRYSEDQKTRKRRSSSSSDDFCSDSTSKNNDHLPQNLTLLLGPHGSGKTSSVYGLCAELSINVIEINASTKRPGKKILADLLEATQSHQVKNTDSKSVTSFFQKKPDSQNEDDVNKKLSLLLFEDVDIVFEDQDESFISALSTLIISSKRPIILTSTDKTCPHLQKFIQQYSVIYFNSLSCRILNPWLQILCLVEGIRADKDMINRLIEWNKGDIRKTILQLQFWVQTGGDHSSETHKINESTICSTIKQARNSTDEEIGTNDEDSNMSWINLQNNCDKNDENSKILHRFCAESFVSYYQTDVDGFKLTYPLNLEILWWNIPKLLGQNTTNFLTNENVDVCEKSEENIVRNKECLLELNNVSTFLDSVAFSNNVHTCLKMECYEEPIFNYWQINPADSLSLEQNVNMYSETYNTSMEITHWMVENAAKQCRRTENINIAQDVNTSIPYTEELRWRSKRHKGMKELLNAVPAFSLLDRKAICEDYQTALRTISRSENDRIVNNSKRKNRFYHYFKNLNIHVNDTTYKLLCNTFATD